MKVAIIHYWLVGMRGGERVLEELLRIYPQADVFTHVADPARLSPTIRDRNITETYVARLPGARKYYQYYLGFMPRALEELDMRGYDLIVSSESGPAKGIIPPPFARHICYVHSPMRYIWDHYHGYTERFGRVGRLYFSCLAHRLRQWDVTTAARVDRFVANSSFVAQRIERYYRRKADVVLPPVDLETYSVRSEQTERSYYLFVSQLVPYKRADIVVEAFRGFDRPLKVVGEGVEKAALERTAPTNVEVMGWVEQMELLGLYQGAKALIFPAEEDFGIIPLESMACGTPVLAYGRGGVRDSIIDGETGLFFDRQDAQSIRDAVLRFEALDKRRFVPTHLNEHAKRFSAERFRVEFTAIAEEVLETARPVGI